MKSLLVKLFVIITPFAIVVSVVNYFVDPANIFSGGVFEKEIASILAKGHNVDNVSNYNERILQREALSKSRNADIIILGSSRIMEASSDLFPGQVIQNCGVSHCNINDLIAFTGLMDSLHIIPHKLIIELDIATVAAKGTSEWESLIDFHRYAMKNLLHQPFDYPYENPFLTQVINLLSLNYFHESFAYLLKGAKQGYVDVFKAKPLSSGRFSDGSISYPFEYTHPDTFKIATDAKQDGLRNGMPELSESKLNLMKSILVRLLQSGTKIELVMMPYQVDYFNAVNSKSKKILYRVEARFIEMAADLSIPIFGSLDPYTLHLSNVDFYDRWHCNKEAVKKIFATRK